MRPPITYYGGKQRLVKDLLPLIPAHKLYCEPFMGGGALFFAKPPSEAEIINDLSGEVTNFYTVVQAEFEALKKKIDGTPHSRVSHQEAMQVYKNPASYDKVTRAWAFWVATNQGFAGKIGSWALGRDNKVGKTLAGKREGFTKQYAERLKYVQIESKDALSIIRQYDGKNTFFYLDPPYFNSDCGHYKGYTHQDYLNLLEVLSKIKGKFLLSSYPSDILSEFSKKYKWGYKEKRQKISVTHLSKKEKIEIMVFNYPESKAGFYKEGSPARMHNFSDIGAQRGAEKVQGGGSNSGGTSLHMSVSLPCFGRIRIREAMQLLRIKDIRTFKLWCARHGVTIFNDVGGRYVFGDQLTDEIMKPLRKEMEKKYSDLNENIPPVPSVPEDQPVASTSTTTGLKPSTNGYIPQGKHEARYLNMLMQIATQKNK